MKKSLALILALIAPASLFGALAELNVAEGSIAAPDGSFVGRNFSVVNGFKVELLYVTNTQTEGQWVALAWDNKHRLILPSYNSDRLARATIPPLGSNEPVKVEMLTGTRVAAAEGALYAWDSLYINANRSTTTPSGIYRLRDTNGDDTYDQTRVIRNLRASADHGTHTLQMHPGGQRISFISGNSTRLTDITKSRVPQVWGEDQLIPRLDLAPPGFNRAPEAWLGLINEDGSEVELWGMGMRNPVSHAYNKDGEMFIYDADEEPNMGFTVGYRPTVIHHLISGADMGWRSGSKVQPFHRFDFFAPVGVVGSGSPTGSAFGTGTKFPAKYQDALFISDYSFGNIWAVQVTPDGSSYKAEPMPFLSGSPLAASGITMNTADGTLLVMTTGTQLYRVSYVGSESTAPTTPDARYAAVRQQRHELEKFHGVKNPAAVQAAWASLGDEDRAIRYAARIAIEHQDVATWRERALDEKDARRSIAAIAALARVSHRDDYHTPPGSPPPDKALEERMLAALDRIDWNTIGLQEKLDLLRAYQLTMIRLGQPSEPTRQRLVAKFDPRLPAQHQELNRELAEVLVYLQAPSAPAKIMALMRNAPDSPYYGIQEWINPQQRLRQSNAQLGEVSANIGISQARLAKQDAEIFYAQLLRAQTAGWTPELRKEYMTYFITAPRDYYGANNGLLIIRADAMAMVPETERAPLQSIMNTPMPLTRGRATGGAAYASWGSLGTQEALANAAATIRGTPGIGAPAQSRYVPPGTGRGGAAAVTDLEQTAATRFNEGLEKEVLALQAANAALLSAPFNNRVTIESAARAVADAELAVAMARASAFPKFKADVKLADDKKQAFINAITGTTGGGAPAPRGGQ